MAGYWNAHSDLDWQRGDRAAPDDRVGQCDCCGRENCRLNFRIAYGTETYACDECCGIDDEPAPHTPAQHLDKAIAHLHHAADMRLGWLRDIDLAQAARHLRAAGRDDLATRVENDGEDAVLAELWRAEREQVQW